MMWKAKAVIERRNWLTNPQRKRLGSDGYDSDDCH